jgi:hypothetical protein
MSIEADKLATAEQRAILSRKRRKELRRRPYFQLGHGRSPAVPWHSSR